MSKSRRKTNQVADAAAPSQPRGLTRRNFGRAALLLAIGAAGVSDLPLTQADDGKRTVFRAKRPDPAQVLDLRTWKVGLPTTAEVSNPRLAGFTDTSFKTVQAVQFTARCGDKPQPGSKYARSELREMNTDGSNASWSSVTGTHEMAATMRITHLPAVKPSLICAQIHSSSDYLILVELTGSVLLVRYIDAVAGVLDSDYHLGTAFDLKVVASNGYVDVFHNGAHKVHHAMRQGGCYFKAGCYLQSNTSTGDAPTAYGQVEISNLAVTHAA
jgi:alginate lyase